MSWRHDRWPAYQPRPKVAKLPEASAERLHAEAERFVAKSPLLREIVTRVQLARGRIYL